ncbi:MAG: GNAT family N-acetyltransferase [Acidimicrobiia bacterium]|nr:GNAT family N-acetyltransferase [Acidimicrobiia bacterium]
MLLASRYPEDCDAAGIGRALQDGARRFWLGALDGAAVGFAAAQLSRLADGSLIAGVEALYVLPEARGVGLGEALMDAVLAWATAAGAVGVDSIALPGDRVTKNFFERYGLTARALQVYRQLAPAPEAGQD